MPITTEAEFESKLKQLTRLYRAIRHEFARVQLTEVTAAQLLTGTGKIVDKVTDILGDIEDYSGAADIRMINSEMRKIREKRENKSDE